MDSKKSIPCATQVVLHITKEVADKYNILYKIYYDIFDQKVKCGILVKSGTSKKDILDEEKNILRYGHTYTKPYVIELFEHYFDVIFTLHFTANGFLVFLLHYSNNPALIASVYSEIDAESHILNICKCFNPKDSSIIMQYLKQNGRLGEIPVLEKLGEDPMKESENGGESESEKIVVKTESAEIIGDGSKQ